MNNRMTYAKVSIKNIKENVTKIINKYNNYKYYFGVVKADCYGMGDIEVIKSVIEGGCNYLAVALLEEALMIRKANIDVPILCLEIVSKENIEKAVNNNITLTVNSKECARELVESGYSNIKVHIKVNTGMNRLGVSNKKEFKEIYEILAKHDIEVEGLYTHMYNSSNNVITNNQIELFKKIIDSIDLSNIKIIHLAASETITGYNKPEFINGCRLGIIMYGFTNDTTLDLQSVFSLHSKVVQINELKMGDVVGYNGLYVANKNERVAVVSIGYADGVIRKNTGRSVYINNKEYKIVGNVCMDMLFVLVDDTVKVNDDVIIIKDNNHINEIAKHLDTIPYEIICTIGKRVPRIYEK